MPASRSRRKPSPATSGFGSSMAATTRATPASISASAQGGVRPWCEQGSRLMYSVAPRARSPASSSARISACLHAGLGVKAAAHHFAVAHQHRAHQRDWDWPAPAPCRARSSASRMYCGVHFSNSDAMNFSASNGSRSSTFSPTPT